MTIGLWPASPALADPARPGNTVSVVESLQPPVSGVMVDIVGGDAFVRVRADVGVEVRVPGYLGEPYLWIRPDGTVWRNAASPATAQNENRYLTDAVPDVTTRPDAALPEPSWQRYGSGGTVLWHDHRVHWMGSGLPPTIDPDGLVQRWEVPLRVDGVEVMVTGTLRRLDGATPWWWLAAGAAAGLTWMARRRQTTLGFIVAGTGLFAATVAWWAWVALPTPARSAPALALLATSAAVMAASGAFRRLTVVGGPLVAGAGSALLLVAWLGAGGVAAAVVPGLSITWPWRLAIPVSLGVGVVALIAGAQTASRSRAPVSLEG
jgi:hypothetical protein